MGKKKVWVEVCLISGRGLRRRSSLWKVQWYAVGWIHPGGDKYCTKIDDSGTSNPLWKTGFTTSLRLDPDVEDMALHVEVYSRDSIFLRESLLGSASVGLREMLEKYSSTSAPVDEVGSFQLRKRNSNKPLGFVDVSIRISQDREEDPSSSYLAAEEGFNLDNHGVPMKEGSLGNSHQTETSYQMPIPPNQPLPSSNFPPITPSSYMNMATTAAAHRVGMGVGAGGALAAVFGDRFMSALPDATQTHTVSTYRPF